MPRCMPHAMGVVSKGTHLTIERVVVKLIKKLLEMVNQKRSGRVY